MVTDANKVLLLSLPLIVMGNMGCICGSPTAVFRFGMDRGAPVQKLLKLSSSPLATPPESSGIGIDLRWPPLRIFCDWARGLDRTAGCELKTGARAGRNAAAAGSDAGGEAVSKPPTNWRS